MAKATTAAGSSAASVSVTCRRGDQCGGRDGRARSGRGCASPQTACCAAVSVANEHDHARQVAAQGDCDDGEVGGEDQDWEQLDVVRKHVNAVALEVQAVQAAHPGRRKAERGGHGQHHVEHVHADQVQQQHARQPRLVLDGRHQRRQAVTCERRAASDRQTCGGTCTRTRWCRTGRVAGTDRRP